MLQASVRPDPKAPFARAEITVRGLPSEPSRPGFQLRRSTVDYIEPNLDIAGWTRGDVVLLPLEHWWSDDDRSFHFLISGLLCQHIDPGPLKLRLPAAASEVDLFWPDDIAVYDDGNLPPPAREVGAPASDEAAEAARRAAAAAAEAARAQARREAELQAAKDAEAARAQAERLAKLQAEQDAAAAQQTRRQAEREAEAARSVAERQAAIEAQAAQSSPAQNQPTEPAQTKASGAPATAKPQQRRIGTWLAVAAGLAIIGGLATRTGEPDATGPIARPTPAPLPTPEPTGFGDLTPFNRPPVELRAAIDRVVADPPPRERDAGFNPFLSLRPANEIIAQTTNPESLLRYGQAKLEQNPPDPVAADRLFEEATKPRFGPAHNQTYPPAFLARALLYDPAVTQNVSLPMMPKPDFAETLYKRAVAGGDADTAALAREYLRRLQTWRTTRAETR